MFLLSFIALIWALSFVWRVLAIWLLSVVGDGFTLRDAELVVVSTSQEPGSVHAVDITQEMLTLQRQRGRKRLDLMPSLMGVAFRGDLRDTLVRCYASSDATAQVRRVPMCFLDIRYTVKSPWRIFSQEAPPVHRCLYPIYSFSDYVYYPPKCPLVPLARPHTTMTSAILTLRYVGEMTRQLSCNVTERMRLLEGPMGDFHRDNHAGYQLRKHILRVVLMPDVRALMDALDREEIPANRDASSNSLKSLGRTSRPPVSIRLQVRMSNHRTEVMSLENAALST